MRKFLYGQIRPSNYELLFRHFNWQEPPWNIADAPHCELVRAVISGSDPSLTSYFDYIKNDKARLAGSVEVVKKALAADSLSCDMEVDSVLDGNHRVAVHLVTRKPIKINASKPYQTVRWADGSTVAGRRIVPDIPLSFDFTGKRVLDVGANCGMNSLAALVRGAEHVTSIDIDFKSTIWQLRDSYGISPDKWSIVPTKAEDFSGDFDVAMAFSVHKHMAAGTLEKMIEGRDCIYENHAAGDGHPETNHEWTQVVDVPYSVAEPSNTRNRYVGRWLNA